MVSVSPLGRNRVTTDTVDGYVIEHLAAIHGR
jgi:hypothetical protein